MNNCMPMSQSIASFAYDDYSGGAGYGYGGGEQEEFGYDMFINQGSTGSFDQMNITETQNFLKNPPFTAFNLVPNQDGEVSFTANLKPYTQLYILAIDLNSVAQRQVDIASAVNEATQKRDLSLAKSLPIDDRNGFTESRTTEEVTKDTVKVIEDITSTEIQLIDDLKKVKGVLEELMRMNYRLDQAGPFKELSALFMKWPSLAGKQEEKAKLFYKHLCHELSFFIKLKDGLFFNEVVRPFIQNKLEKTFMDYYLLDQHKHLANTYKGLERIKNLNAFEKCLLVDAFIKLDKKAEAKRLVDHIKLTKESQEYINVDNDNKLFDIVLNLNMLIVNPLETMTGSRSAAADPFNDLLSGPSSASQLGYFQPPSAQPQMNMLFGSAQFAQASNYLPH